MQIKIEHPDDSNLISTYNHVQKFPEDLTFFIKFYGWVRFDPRLGEILIQNLVRFWTQWNPMLIAAQLKTDPWPGVFGVLGSHAELLLDQKSRRQFRLWLSCCLSQIHLKREWPVFFIGNFSFGGKAIFSEAEESLAIYTRWGFLAKTAMIQPSKKLEMPTRTLLSQEFRLQKLRTLFSLKKRIRIVDYLKFLDFKVSKRTAELDLKKWAKRHGRTRAATYTFL